MEQLDYSKIKVLVLGGSGRQMLPILRELHELKCSVTTINSSIFDVGFSSRYPNHRIIIKNTGDYKKDFIDSMNKEIDKGNYDVIIHLSDMITDYLATHYDNYRLKIHGFFPNEVVFNKIYDKQKTMKECFRNSIAIPETYFGNEDICDFIRRVGFPLVIKPRKGCGSVGFKIIRNKEVFLRLLNDKSNFLDTNVIQAFIAPPAKQYNVHMFLDSKQKVCMGVPTEKCRWFPVDGGASCFCRIIQNEKLVDIAGKLLKAIGWSGCAEVEFIFDQKDQKYKVMEINGRTSASIKICDLAGVNVAEQMIQLSLGWPVKSYASCVSDIRMRCSQTDLLWFFFAKDRFCVSPSWFDRKNTHDQIFSFLDPIPWFTYSIQAVARVNKEMKKRKRD
jgi:predicted ATP-grasp superfamily ATP-dependent carboligase